ncbi:uncharacterized protein LOC119352194 [Triticum dicoccoides]|uniref:uncharacterized protein LOC119352194 n=1 Tax=Triticum dicoccoides TaxID=85692 RepID=UPI00188E97E3|nr:uncharacterized protein LOC119352194 [Triticum dicoccoides]
MPLQGGDLRFPCGERFYKCVRKDARLCPFMRTMDTYLPELTRVGLAEPQVLHHSMAMHQSAPVQRRSRREQEFIDGSQREIQPDHAAVRLQMQQANHHPRAQAPCCSSDTQRTSMLLAGTNFILVVALLYLIFGQPRG